MSEASLLKPMGIEEMVDAGLQPFTSDGSDINHNPLVESILTGVDAPRYDARGRLVISFRQYAELQARDAQMSQYALEMTLPSKPHIRQLVPASKYLKYWGSGLEVVGAPVEETHVYADTLRRLRIRGMEQEEAMKQTKKMIADRNRVSQAPSALRQPEVTEEAIVAFRCRDKYPDCARFFDTARGLQFHWRNEHGEAPMGRYKAKAEAAKAEAEE